MAYEVPDVTVEQIFTAQNPTLNPPTLPSVLIGTCNQIEYRQSGGEYAGDSISIPYPLLKSGAEVDPTSIDVYLSNEDGVFQINNYTADADSINIDAGIALDVRVVENSQTGETSGIFFQDTNVNFFSRFKGSSFSGSVIISSPSDNQKSYTIREALDKNNLIIVDDTTFIGGGSLPISNNVINTTSVAVQQFILEGPFAFESTYAPGTTVINGETIINANTQIAIGDYISFDSLSFGTNGISKILNVNSSTRAITIDALADTVTSAINYQIFRPVRVRDVALSNSGDYVIANTVSGSDFYAEIATINGIDTITLNTELKDFNGNVNSSWTGGRYTINRGALKNTNSNVYDGYLTKIDYSAAVLVSYKALRHDLSDDVTPITGQDDIDAILGVQSPDNPLGLGANIHNRVSTSLFYVVGVDGETVNSYAKALEILEAKEVYSLVPLTQDLAITGLMKPHVDSMSQPKEKMERSALINRDIFIASDIAVSGSSNIVIGGTDSAHNFVLGLVNQGNPPSDFNNTTSMNFTGVGFNANTGDKVFAFAGGDQGTVTVATISSVATDYSSISFSPALTITQTDGYQICSSIGMAGSFINVENGDVINLLDNNGLVNKTATITDVPTMVDGRKLLVLDSDLGTSLKNKDFSVTTEPLNKLEQAQYMRDYARSIADRRVVNVYLPEFDVTFTDETGTDQTGRVPGFYMAAAIAAMKAENKPSQPFTNLSIPLNAKLYYTNTYFKPTYLDTIAEGGNYIIVQDNADALPYSRQQLTTDTSTIEAQEYSILTAIDWYAKFIRTQLRPFIGKYNITGNYLAQLKVIANAVNKKVVKDLEYLASVNIITIAQDKTAPDEVFMDLDIGVLYPANKIRVRLYI